MKKSIAIALFICTLMVSGCTQWEKIGEYEIDTTVKKHIIVEETSLASIVGETKQNPSVSQGEEILSVEVDALRLRKKPDPSAGSVTLLEKGARLVYRVETIGSDGNVWYEAVLEKDETKSGYVYAKYVSKKSAENVIEKTAVVTEDLVNVRQGPSTDTKILGKVTRNAKITVLGEVFGDSMKWYRIESPFEEGETGFLSARYAALEHEDAVPEEHSASAGSFNVIVTSEFLRIRSKPGTENPVLGELGKDEVVSVIGEKRASDNSKWYEITWNGDTKGYISSYYVDPTTNTPNAAPTKVQGFEVIVIGDILNVRAEPTTDSEKLGTLQNGEVLAVQEDVTSHDGEKWYRITYKGRRGYVNATYTRAR